MIAANLADTSSPTTPIIIIQLCKLKKYRGVMGLSNAFHGTRLFINGDLEAVVDYRSKSVFL